MISNMTIFFSNSNPKIPKSGNFGPKFRYFCFFTKFYKFEGVGFKYDKNFSKNLAQKHPNKAFLVPNLGIFLFSQNLQLDKFQGGDLKYNNVVFKFQPKNR